MLPQNAAVSNQIVFMSFLTLSDMSRLLEELNSETASRKLGDVILNFQGKGVGFPDFFFILTIPLTTSIFQMFSFENSMA